MLKAEQTGVWGYFYEENPKIFARRFELPDSIGSRSRENYSYQPGCGHCSHLSHALHGRPSARRCRLATRRLETRAHPFVEERHCIQT